MELSRIVNELPHLNVKLNEPLSNYTYTKTGGNADAIVFPKTRAEVVEVTNWVRNHGIPLTILGNASNLIVRDGGIRGIVLILTEMKQVTVDGNVIIAESGTALIDVSYLALEHELSGLEFACGIPGSIGGAVYMNAGAYGGEVVEVIEWVEVVTPQGDIKRYSNEDCEFSYRYSIFQTNDDIILAVKFALKDGNYQAMSEHMAHLMDLRRSKQPLEYPSCGSVFKRPVGHFTGQLIQEAGLQGYRIGGAEISKKHAGFIVNIAGATATDYVQLIEFIQKTIWDLNQVRLETEVRIIGEEVI
ncbi:UDP-N-acetylmuramate dehydrogenase [Fundicoccus culcitae]|uniref:UDP-N-acetylenolpyruvoylglucosamine reductase n=1 Tax=Fundicoccus culcitae TaxID=2969821 RepID=A0ABY5P9R7_9LACT|nr:UDP-N-acetylmuramate dehydrogenase [Fundicoccus culcitae]UUX35487.1 UDP-N-acetylmuramate dehydrogenase [Fundicoccus culcitae]